MAQFGQRHQGGVYGWLHDGFISIFLPVGYPDSVTEDFTRFRILDTAQNVASPTRHSIVREMLIVGVGVGDPTSTATGAVLLTVIQDSTGRLATILFAWRASSALSTEPQKYRFLADTAYDLALLSDCLVPRLLPYRLPLLCFSGVARALCGVMANAVGTTMTAHFARRGNLADLSAKGASLGTVAQLVGTALGTGVIHSTEGVWETWCTLIILIILHLALNYKCSLLCDAGVDGRCIKSVVLLDINRQRASLILSSIFPDSLEVRPLTQIPTPLEISRREKLFVDNRILSRAEHTADIGVASTAVYNAMKGPTSARNKVLHEIFSNEEYILWPVHTRRKRVHILISLTSPSLKVHFKAWAHAYVLALLLSQSSSRMSSASGGVVSDVEVVGGEVKRALELVRGAFEGGIERALGGRGWNVDKSMICVGLEGRGEWRGVGGGEDWTEDIEKRE